MVNGSLLQAWLTGIPLLVIVRGNPSALFVVGAVVLFLTSLAILLLIFVPKIDYLQVQRKKDGGDGRNPSQGFSTGEDGLNGKVYFGSARGKSFSNAVTRSSFVSNDGVVPDPEDQHASVADSTKSNKGSQHDTVAGLKAAISDHLDPIDDSEEGPDTSDDGLHLNVANSPVGETGTINV